MFWVKKCCVWVVTHKITCYSIIKQHVLYTLSKMQTMPNGYRRAGLRPGTPCPSAGQCRPTAGHSVPSAGLRPALRSPVQASAGLRPALPCPSAPKAVPAFGRALRAPVPAFGRHSVPPMQASAGLRPSAGTPCLYSAPMPALLPCPQCPESPSARAGQCRTAAAGLAAFTRR